MNAPKQLPPCARLCTPADAARRRGIGMELCAALARHHARRRRRRLGLGRHLRACAPVMAVGTLSLFHCRAPFPVGALRTACSSLGLCVTTNCSSCLPASAAHCTTTAVFCLLGAAICAVHPCVRRCPHLAHCRPHAARSHAGPHARHPRPPIQTTVNCAAANRRPPPLRPRLCTRVQPTRCYSTGHPRCRQHCEQAVQACRAACPCTPAPHACNLHPAQNPVGTGNLRDHALWLVQQDHGRRQIAPHRRPEQTPSLERSWLTQTKQT